MRIVLSAAFMILAVASLAACGLETQRADSDSLLPPGDRPARGPGLFTGEDGVFTIHAD